MDTHAVVEEIIPCVLFVSNLLSVCHSIMCDRDKFLNHVLLSQKQQHMLLSYFNAINHFITQEVYFSIIADDFFKA